MKIFFIRHGETTGDIEDRYGGDYDDHLSDKGKQQSTQLAEQLKDRKIQAIFASPLIRAQETAGIIGVTAKAEVFTETGLRERNQYGILTGMIKSEAKKKYPEMAEALKERLNTIEGAETYEAFSERVSKSFNNVVNDVRYSTIAIISHGGPLRVLFRDILKWGELKDIGDCAFVELDYDGKVFSWIHSGGFTPSFQIPVFGTK